MLFHCTGRAPLVAVVSWRRAEGAATWGRRWCSSSRDARSGATDSCRARRHGDVRAHQLAAAAAVGARPRARPRKKLALSRCSSLSSSPFIQVGVYIAVLIFEESSNYERESRGLAPAELQQQTNAVSLHGDTWLCARPSPSIVLRVAVHARRTDTMGPAQREQALWQWCNNCSCIVIASSAQQSPPSCPLPLLPLATCPAQLEAVLSALLGGGE